MTLTIQTMTEADVAGCAELETVLFPGDSPWPESAFVAELASPHVSYFVVREEKAVIAYAGVSVLGHAGTGSAESEVHTIGVDPSMHRRGLGGRLLDRLLAVGDAHGGPMFLEVRTDNVAAIALYHREGFEIVGTRRRYYQPSGADAYTMRRPPAGRSEESGQAGGRSEQISSERPS